MKYRMFLGFSSLSLGLLAGCGSDSTSTATEDPVVESASNPCIYEGYTGYYAADNETLICVDPTGAIAFWISPDGTFGYPNTETQDGTGSTVATSSNSASPESSPSNPAQGSTTEPVPGSSSAAIPGTAESSSSGEAVTEACPGNPTAAYSIAGVNYYFDGQKYYYLDAECNRIYIEPATSSSSQAVVVSSSSMTRSSSSQEATSSTTAPGASSSSQASGSSTIGGGDTDDNENDDTDSRTLDGTETLITVNGTSASIENDNGCLTLGDKNVTVTCSGSYYFTGKGSDFQILVNVANAADLENVGIYFYNLDLTSSSAPVIVVSAEKTVFHIVKGTTNTLTNGTTLTTFTKKDGSSDDADAVIVAKDDINFKGAGSLTINGKLSDGSGIKCSNDIKIKNGNITVTASNNGIKGKGSVQISGGTLNVTSTAGDGIKSDEGEDEGTVVA
ncbi:MAG: carbohydrate-binding domain-containing protein, partial [Fibrobacter sp.]|nr:carbohydrate-binding domain-containing protein [Fibrobacter sp.]